MRASDDEPTPGPAPGRSPLCLAPDQAAGIPELWSGDVVVAGGGSAGVSAAIAAAELGARTLLVEPAGFFGGTAVAVLDTMYGFFPPGSTERVVGGIGWRVADALLRRDQAILRANTYGAGTGVTYEPEALKVEWDDLVTAAGVHPLLHAVVSAVIMDGSLIESVVVQTRRGPYRVSARRFVDATGDGVLAWVAGCSLERPDAERRVQPLTTTFRVGGVGTPASTAELHQRMIAAAADGLYRLPRLEGSAHRTVLPGVFHTNMTRVSGVDPTDPWAATAAEMEGRAQAQEYVRFLRDCVPGYESSYLLSTSVWIGTRESRRLLGEYVLTRDDVLGATQFDDAIALCGAPVEDHGGGATTIWRYVGSGGSEPTGLTYGIPYRSLVPAEVDGLIVAGRCLSATHDAHASARSIGQCLAYGQAAGTAAALSIANAHNVELRDLDVGRLRSTLVENGAIL
jgi:hypothetical protein